MVERRIAMSCPIILMSRVRSSFSPFFMHLNLAFFCPIHCRWSHLQSMFLTSGHSLRGVCTVCTPQRAAFLPCFLLHFLLFVLLGWLHCVFCCFTASWLAIHCLLAGILCLYQVPSFLPSLLPHLSLTSPQTFFSTHFYTSNSRMRL